MMNIWKKTLITAFIISVLAFGVFAQDGVQDQDAPKKPRERPEVPVKKKKDEPPRERPKEDKKEKPPKK